MGKDFKGVNAILTGGESAGYLSLLVIPECENGN
jgi:hypothetical protein